MMKIYLSIIIIIWAVVILWANIHTQEPTTQQTTPIKVMLEKQPEQRDEVQEQPKIEPKELVTAQQEQLAQKSESVPEQKTEVKQNNLSGAGAEGASARWQLKPKEPSDEALLLSHFFAREGVLLDVKTKQIYALHNKKLQALNQPLEDIHYNYRAFSVSTPALMSLLSEPTLQAQYWVLLPNALAENIYPVELAEQATSLVVVYDATEQGVMFTLADARNEGDVVTSLVGRQWSLQ